MKPTPTQPLQLSLRLDRLAEVVATVGYIPAGLIGALGERNYDLVRHHRLRIIKYGGDNFSNPARGRKFLASRLSGYGRKVPNPTTLEQLQGESFLSSRSQDGMAKRTGRPFPLDDASMKRLETGGTVNTSEQMAVPIGYGVQQTGPYKGLGTALFYRTLAAKGFDIINTPAAKGLLVLQADARKKAGVEQGARTLIMGKLIRRRITRPRLGFFQQWASILPAHQAKYDAAIQKALTAAGRASLELRAKSLEAGRKAWEAEYKKLLTANPANHAGARRAAAEAARQARADALGKGRA